jgi:alkylhydroperoxidase family enzyme
MERAYFTERVASYPAIATTLSRMHRAAWEVHDTILLELCRLRIAQILGCQAENDEYSLTARRAGLSDAMIDDLPRWYSSARFSHAQKACLAFTEQFVMDVTNLSEAQVCTVSEHLGTAGLVDLASAVLVIEQRHRLATTWTRIFGGIETGD